MKKYETKNVVLEVNKKGVPHVWGLFCTNVEGVDGKYEDRTMLQGLFYTREAAKAAAEEIDYNPRYYKHTIRKLSIGDYYWI